MRKMTSHKYIPQGLLICMFSMLLLQGCSGRKTAKEEIGFGTMYENGLYVNEYFNMMVEIPLEWKIQKNEQQEELLKLSADLNSGNKKEKRDEKQYLEQNTVSLIQAFRYSFINFKDDNPSLICIAERVSHVPAVKNGRDYLQVSQELITKGNKNYSRVESIGKTQLGGIEFDTMELEAESFGTTVYQTFYAWVEKDYVLCLIFSHSTEEGYEEFKPIIESMRFDADAATISSKAQGLKPMFELPVEDEVD